MLKETKNAIEEKIILMISMILQFPINYIKYIFLTGSVIFSVGILLLLIVFINPQFSFGFLKYFWFINPIYATGTFSMGIKEIMEIFLIVSLIFMIIINLIKIALKMIFNLELLSSLKSKIITFFTLITSAYILASIIVFYNKLDKGFYFVFVIFYIINLVSAIFYFLLDALSDALSKKITKIFEREPSM
jgi:hypothetical protein